MATPRDRKKGDRLWHQLFQTQIQEADRRVSPLSTHTPQSMIGFGCQLDIQLFRLYVLTNRTDPEKAELLLHYIKRIFRLFRSEFQSVWKNRQASCSPPTSFKATSTRDNTESPIPKLAYFEDETIVAEPELNVDVSSWNLMNRGKLPTN